MDQGHNSIRVAWINDAPQEPLLHSDSSEDRQHKETRRLRGVLRLFLILPSYPCVHLYTAYRVRSLEGVGLGDVVAVWGELGLLMVGLEADNIPNPFRKVYQTAREPEGLYSVIARIQAWPNGAHVTSRRLFKPNPTIFFPPPQSTLSGREPNDSLHLPGKRSLHAQRCFEPGA